MTYARFGELLQSLAAEVLVANENVTSTRGRDRVRGYSRAIEIYMESLTKNPATFEIEEQSRQTRLDAEVDEVRRHAEDLLAVYKAEHAKPDQEASVAAYRDLLRRTDAIGDRVGKLSAAGDSRFQELRIELGEHYNAALDKIKQR